MPSESIRLALRSSPQPYHTIKCCKIQGKDMLVINSGESVLVFDLEIALTQGTSGLIRTLQIVDLLGKQ